MIQTPLDDNIHVFVQIVWQRATAKNRQRLVGGPHFECRLLTASCDFERAHHDLAADGVHALFLDARAAPLDAQPQLRTRTVDEPAPVDATNGPLTGADPNG